MSDKFYVGAKVVCVNDTSATFIPLEIKKGKVYEVEAIAKSPCCKNVLIDVGETPRSGNVRCAVCSGSYVANNQGRYYNSFRFRLLEPDTELSETTVDEILDLINAEK